MKKKNLITSRRELRQNLTPAEAQLWKYIQKKQLAGRKFRRQHQIENYIVDFYCAKEKIIIELDGEIHFNTVNREQDYLRDKHLMKLGYKVLRFENKQVFEDLKQILNEIESNFKNV
ncbi:cytosine methyltransferase [Croceivirga radicis]|uniref:Cytosine methyltransferase n=1 Tax=Croceivirga radicis TaxID=1929488 RepID=A0A1V6LUV2_9FLAO|nr:endonuclease domain-containing protein [Croceivirga radicis]OQD43954.1 cytosine methyltransferase [Croceivirga radicis]